MDNTDKLLANFERYLDEMPPEELDAMVAKVDAMGLEGPTVEEYFDAASGSPMKIAALQARISELETRLNRANEYLDREGKNVKF